MPTASYARSSASELTLPHALELEREHARLGGELGERDLVRRRVAVGVREDEEAGHRERDDRRDADGDEAQWETPLLVASAPLMRTPMVAGYAASVAQSP